MDLERERVENYLSAFGELVLLAKDDSALKWLLYPFSAIIFDAVEGNTAGVLLSPLHPIRLAWAWSVQSAADEVREQVEDVVRLIERRPGATGLQEQGSDRRHRKGCSPLDSAQLPGHRVPKGLLRQRAWGNTAR